MEWKSASTNDKGLHQIPKRWLLLHYYEAQTILFRFENSLRVFVYAVLKSSLKSAWKDCALNVGEDQTSIKAVVSKRISQAQNFGYLGYPISSPMMHLTSGELIDLLTSDAHWPKFKKYFRGSKEIIKNKLLEIGSVRNSIAHFRPVRAEDVELIKQNSRHVLLGIEECLIGVFSQSLRVPTNSKDAWYQKTRTLGTERVHLIPYASVDGEWINLQFRFQVPILEHDEYTGDFHGYTVANINSPNILSDSAEIRENITYLSEQVGYPTIDSSSRIDVIKYLNLVFSRQVLEGQLDVIVDGLKAALAKISEECELLQGDALAKGSLLESARCSAYLQPSSEGNSSWKINYEELFISYEADHPDEYWGRAQYSSDVVAGTPRYPWMPEDISQREGFLD